MSQDKFEEVENALATGANGAAAAGGFAGFVIGTLLWAALFTVRQAKAWRARKLAREG